ncbi:MAG TPA: hypothetical protein VGH38_38005 [Bryobacteraceae bacterium]
MHPRELVIALIAGGAAIAVGLIPGIFQGLMDGIQNFGNRLSSPFPMRPFPQGRYREAGTQPWLAVIGAALIVMSVLGYFFQ